MKKNGFFNDFKTAIFGFDRYSELTERSFAGCLCFMCIISVLSALLIAAPFALEYISKGGVSKFIETNAGDFSIENGVFKTEKEYDNVIKTDFFDIHIKADPNSNYDSSELPDISEDFLFVGIYKDKTAVYQGGVESGIFLNRDLELIGINNKEGLISLMRNAVFLAALFLLFINLFSAFMEIVCAYFTVRLVFSVSDRKFESEAVFKICAYARTMPVVLLSVLSFISSLSSYTRFVMMRYPIYIAVYAAYIFIIIRECEKKAKKTRRSADSGEVSENNTNNDINEENYSDENSNDKTVICELDDFDSSKFE